MKDNLSLLFALIVGIGVGAFDIAPEWLLNPSLPMIVLSALIIQVGIGVGSMDNLGKMLRSINLKMFLLPACTIVGTLVFTALAFFLFNTHELSDIMAIGSGFGYYSLSSVLIAQLKTITVGATQATQLATIAIAYERCSRATFFVWMPFLYSKRRELSGYFDCRYQFNGCLSAFNS